MKKFFLIFFIFLFVFNNTNAQKIIEISNDFQNIAIGKSIEILKDSNKEYTFEQISSLNFQSKYKQSDKIIPFYNYQNSTYWLKFTIKNTTFAKKQFYLLIDYPLLYKIKLFIPTDTRIDTLFCGDGFPFQKRKIKLPTNLFELSLDSAETKTYYCSIESDGDVVSIPISIISNNHLIETTSIKNILFGIYYGIMLIIFMLNLFYFFHLRDKTYLIYALYIFFMGLFIASLDGLTFQFFWQNFPFWNNISVSIFALTSAALVLYMLKLTLDTKKYFPILDKIIVFSILSMLILEIPLFLPAYYRFFISFGNIVVGYGILLSIITIIFSFRKKHYFAKFFSVALFFLIISSFMLIMKNNGLTGIFQFPYWLKIGVGIELLILTYGISVRFNKMLQKNKQEAIARLEQIKTMKEEANIKLEEQVIQRTYELSKKNNELGIIIKKVKKQKEKIEKQAEEVNLSNILLNEKNEEINQQKEELLAQKDEIEIHRDLVLEQKHKMTMGIEYAKKIQKAVFPEQKLFSKYFSDFFIYFKPRDIVSGDFFWIKEIRTETSTSIFIAAADCTGHGVSGAFMSMLGITFLDEIINHRKIYFPAQILNTLRKYVKDALNQTNKFVEAREGMDIALCKINTENLNIKYAGANIPLYIFRKQVSNNYKLEITPADRMPIGIYPKSKEFTCKNIQLKTNDRIYLFSDGYKDQFGGEKNNKFCARRFRELLTEISTNNMEIQKQKLNSVFDKWKGINKQIDDVLIIGVELGEKKEKKGFLPNFVMK